DAGIRPGSSAATCLALLFYPVHSTLLPNQIVLAAPFSNAPNSLGVVEHFGLLGSIVVMSLLELVDILLQV
ncbi:hypothetical protein S245_005198, partial [Arachis hypogaea]